MLQNFVIVTIVNQGDDGDMETDATEKDTHTLYKRYHAKYEVNDEDVVAMSCKNYPNFPNLFIYLHRFITFLFYKERKF